MGPLFRSKGDFNYSFGFAVTSETERESACLRQRRKKNVIKGTHARDFIVRFSHFFGIIQ
jgi:hypothetical protein